MNVSKPVKNPVKKSMYLLAGHVFVGLGILGALLPLMPTTVFLLLAGTCYAKSSPSLHTWLHTNRYFGKYLKAYVEKQGTPLSVKIVSLTVLWSSILYTVLFTSVHGAIRVLLLMIALGVTIHLVTLKTYKDPTTG